MAKILDSSEDETDGLNSEPEAPTSSSATDEELDLPEGTFIVEKITDHQRYDKLKRKELIAPRRNMRPDSLFFLVQWKGYPGEDTWEPLQTIHKVNAFKKYAQEHNLSHLIAPDSSDSESSSTDDDSDARDSGNDDRKRQGKASTASAPKFTKRRHKVDVEEENSVESAVDVPRKKTWWFRSGEKKKKFNYEKLFRKRKAPQGAQDHEDEKKKARKIIRCGPIRKYIEPIIKYKNRSGSPENVEFIVNTRRTRSMSPVADKLLRVQIFDVKGGKNFQDDTKFLEGTRISTAIAQVEQAFLEKKLQEGRILRHIWKKVCDRKLFTPLQQIRDAKPCNLENVLTKVMKRCKLIDEHCVHLQRHLEEQSAFMLRKDMQHLKALCDPSSESIDAVIFDAVTVSEDRSLISRTLLSKCGPEHRVCGIFKILLSSFSPDYLIKLFEHLRRETSNRLLDIVVSIAISADEFCLLDTLISFGANVGFAKSRALQQCVLNGNEEAALHLVLKGFEVNNVESADDSKISEDAFKVSESLDLYMDRLKLKMEKWTVDVLKENCVDAHPVSSVYVHRIGQLDKKICLTVSCDKSPSDSDDSANKLQIVYDGDCLTENQVLVIHSIGLLSAHCIKEIGIKRRCPPIHLPKHLKFRLGARVDEMDLLRLLQKHGSYIYWFPHGHSDELNARVHVKLSYTPAMYRNELDDLLVLQLWNVQMSQLMLPSLRRGD